MTSPEGKSEFRLPETHNVYRGEEEGSIEVEGEQNLLFPAGKVSKCFVIPLNSKLEKKQRRGRLRYAGWLTILLQFQRALPDHVLVENSYSISYVSPGS